MYKQEEGGLAQGMWGCVFPDSLGKVNCRQEKLSGDAQQQEKRTASRKGQLGPDGRCGCRSRRWCRCKGAPRSVALENRGGWWCWREYGTDFPAWAGRIKQVAGRSDRLKGQVTVLLQAASCLGGDGQLGRIGWRSARISCVCASFTHPPGASGQVGRYWWCRVVTSVARWQSCWRPQPGDQGKRLVNCNGARAQQCPVGPVLSRPLVVLFLLVLVPNLES